MRDEEKTKEDLLHEIGQLREKVKDLEKQLVVGGSPQEGFDKLGVGLITQAGHSHYESDTLVRIGGKPQTIPADLSSLFTEEITDSGSFDIRGDIWASTFSKVLQALPIPALLVDQSTVVFQTNQAWERIIQDSMSIVGKAFSDLFSHEYSSQEAQSLIQTVFTDRKTRVTNAWLRIDNVEIWARVTFRPIRIMKERYILVLIEDLTTQSRQLLLNYEHEQVLKKEIELRIKAEKALRESEEKYRLVVENAKEVIFVIQEGKIVFANAEGIKRSGYTEKGLINRSYLEFVHPDDRELVADRYTNRMQKLEVSEAYPIRILYQDGSIWWGYFNMLVID